MTGHNQDEASRYVPNSLITNEASYAAYLESIIMPLANNATALNFITQVLYPPVFDGSQGYTNQTERNNLTVADAFVCNARFMDQASFVPETYAYEFSVPPAIQSDFPNPSFLCSSRSRAPRHCLNAPVLLPKGLC